MSEYHIVVRIEPSLKGLINRVAQARGECISNFVRRAIKSELARLSYLTPDEKKALGIETEYKETFDRVTNYD